jgi:hypothetical protein
MVKVAAITLQKWAFPYFLLIFLICPSRYIHSALKQLNLGISVWTKIAEHHVDPSIGCAV